MQYEVEGRIEQTIYKMDGGVQSQTRSQFTVFVNDCSWLIHETNFDADDNFLAVNETGGIGGGLIYSVIVRQNTINGRFGSQANIYSNNVPVGELDADDISHLWLMFASGCYFKNLSTNWLTPMYNPSASALMNPLLKRQAKWELAGGLSSLPTNILYFQGGAESLIDATYTATGVTNAGILKIPSGFVFEQRVGIMYAPGPILPGDTTPAYHIRKRAVATITAVRQYCSRTQFMPTATGQTYVTDKRLIGVPPNRSQIMTYIFSDGIQWVSIAEAKRLSAANLNPVLATRTIPTKPPSKLIVVLILSLPAAVVLSLWFLNRRPIPAVLSKSESGNPQNSGDNLTPSKPPSNS